MISKRLTYQDLDIQPEKSKVCSLTVISYIYYSLDIFINYEHMS